MTSTRFIIAVVAASALIISDGLAERINLKLVGGSTDAEGTLYVQRESNWGLVCDDNWNIKAGNVVCRQLGYARATKATSYNAFKAPYSDKIFLDDVSCSGSERNFGDCQHREWMSSNCHAGEAAGVICEGTGFDNVDEQDISAAPIEPPEARSPVPSTEELLERSRELLSARRQQVRRQYGNGRNSALGGRTGTARYNSVSEDEVERVDELIDELEAESRDIKPQRSAKPYRVELVGGRSSTEGYVKVHLDNGRSGAICSDNWGLSEATVACRETGNKYADRATTSDFFRGKNEDKVFYEVSCDGHERRLADCTYKLISRDGVKCSRPSKVAGVVCTSASLPDLIPSIRALQSSIHIQEAPLSMLTCAMEEHCLSSSAYTQRSNSLTSRLGTGSFGSFGLGGWSHLTRRLLRFSSSIFNNGTADFRPKQHRSSWEWHSCHMHYHSMDTFSRYDILDSHGNRVAEGHKASFCLEDVECNYPHRKKYVCRGHSDQGISVGCADVYKSDIDCQWIDITDLSPGAYVFKLNVNPEKLVPELSFDNNAAICEMNYSGYSVKLRNCRLSRG